MKIKILIVEHDPIDIELIQYELRNGKVNYVAEIVQTEKEFKNSMHQFVPDIILSDFTFPAFSGTAAFKIKEEIAPLTPFIIVSGSIGEETSIDLIKNGVTDFVFKDRLFTLNTKIKRGLDEAREKLARKKTEELNMRSEQRFRHTLDSMIEGAQIHDFDWNYLYVNDALVNYSTYKEEELIGYSMLDKYPGIEQTDLFKTLKYCMDERKSQQLETEFVYPDGSKAWFQLNIQSIPEGIFILSVNQTEQRKSKERVEKLTRLYAFISAINQSIVHISDEDKLFHNACNVATKIGGFKIAWIGLFDFNAKTLSFVAQNGIPTKEMHLFTDMSYPENGVQDHVLRTGGYYNCDDVAGEPKLEGWMQFAEKHGLHSGIVLPLKKAGIIIGTFNLYSPKINFADEQEIALLEEVVGDISFALDNFEKTKKHDRTEALVIANEKRFRALIEKSPDVKTMSNENGELIYGSPAIAKVLGYESTEILGTLIINYIHPDDQSVFIVQRQSIHNRPGDSFQFLVRLLHKNASWIWCEGTVTNMMHENGVHAFVANFMDVSEKKVAEQQKEFDQNNLHALINNTNDLMWSVDTEMNLITSNQRFDEMSFSINNYLIEKGSNILQGSTTPQTKRFKKHYLRAFAGETFMEVESGESPVKYFSEISYYPIRKGNDIIGTACHSRDITQRKLMEEYLIQSEAKLKESQAIAQIGNWEIDIANNVHVWSEEFCNIYGLNKDEAQPSAESFLSFMHPDDANFAKEEMQKAYKMLEASSFNFRFIRTDGSIRHGFTEWKFETDKTQTPVRMYGILQDITEKKEAKLELQRQNKELIKTNFELDRFVYSVSHDLRSPLTSILGLATFIEQDTKEPDTLQHAEMIKSRINRLDDFIRNILSYSRNNRTELEVQKIDVLSITDEVVASLCNMRDAAGIDFKINVDECIPFYTDRRSFMTVMENIISNAIKFHDIQKTGNTIAITAISDANKLQLTISDNGIGIAPEHHEKIFDMFFRLSGKIDGSGIGLYIVKEIVEKLQGSIAIDSDQGKGTTFIITLKNLHHEF